MPRALESLYTILGINLWLLGHEQVIQDSTEDAGRVGWGRESRRDEFCSGCLMPYWRALVVDPDQLVPTSWRAGMEVEQFGFYFFLLNIGPEGIYHKSWVHWFSENWTAFKNNIRVVELWRNQFLMKYNRSPSFEPLKMVKKKRYSADIWFLWTLKFCGFTKSDIIS